MERPPIPDFEALSQIQILNTDLSQLNMHEEYPRYPLDLNPTANAQYDRSMYETPVLARNKSPLEQEAQTKYET